jgi:hypothetical protein
LEATDKESNVFVQGGPTTSSIKTDYCPYIRGMTPERRLDQLEPLMADALQKIDRLIEGQGKLIDIVTRADQNAANASTKADYAAGRADYAAGRADYAAGRADYAAGRADYAAGRADTAANMAEIAAKGVANLTISTQRQFEELTISTQKQFDELRTGQEAIMNYLREKLP